MTQRSIVDKVLDRLGANDGYYEFMMTNYISILTRQSNKYTLPGYNRSKDLNYRPGRTLIDVIKFLRNTTGFFTPTMPGLKLSKDCVEGYGVLVGYFTAHTRDNFIAQLKIFGITEDDFILTKKENHNG